MSQPVLIVIQGRHHPETEEAYGHYMKGSVPLMQRYRVGIEAVGPGIETAASTETQPINIVLSFPDAEHADGFFLDPDYVRIKEAYRDRAYAEIALALFAPEGGVGERSPAALSITQAEVADAEAYRQLRASTGTLATEHGVTVWAGGAGYGRSYTTDVWPVNTILAYPSEQAMRAFLEDERAAALADLRAQAYGRHRITVSAPRTPRVERNVERT